MHSLSGSGGSLILLVWSGVFCLLSWLIRWPGLPWMLTKWLNFTSQPSLLRWAHPCQWWLLASTKTDILGLMLNACLKDASLLRSDGEMRPVRISGQWRKLDIAGCYTGFLHIKGRHCYTKRRAEVQHPARRWKLVGEATGLGGVTGRSAAPTAVTYSAYLNEKLDDICESTDGAPSPKFMSSNSISEFVQFCPAGFDEVQGLIRSLPSKQRGLHSISTWLLKRRSHLLIPYLVHLFNKSLSSGQFPRSFKEAQVRPILKKSTLDPQLPSSYRPISNLLLPDWIKHLQFAKRRCSALEHTFQEEVKQYYLRPHAMLKAHSIRRSTGLCAGTNSLLPICFRHCRYCCRPRSLQPPVCRWHPDLRPLLT